MNQLLKEKTKNVMRSIALLEDRPQLALQENGEAAVVICLPNEQVGEVMERLPSNVSAVNLVIASANSFEVLAMHKSGREDKVLVVSHKLSMGMLAIKLRHNPGKTIRLDIAPADGASQEVQLLPQLAYA